MGSRQECTQILGLQGFRVDAITCLDARQRAAVEAARTDMHQPYLTAASAALKHVQVVFDKFHVLQHASAALDEVRRQEFFRAGAVMRMKRCS